MDFTFLRPHPRHPEVRIVQVSDPRAVEPWPTIFYTWETATTGAALGLLASRHLTPEAAEADVDEAVLDGCVGHGPLDRAGYEALAAELGVPAHDDVEFQGGFGYWAEHYSYSSSAPRAQGREYALAHRRLLGLRAEAAASAEASAEPETQAATARAPWGSQGIRYDEDCSRCGREVPEVDQLTGLCRQCAGGTRGRPPAPAAERRTVVVTTRLTVAEAARLTAVQDPGESTSDAARRLLLAGLAAQEEAYAERDEG